MLFRKAVLIIHGFAGGTYDEEDLAFHLELNKSFDVYQFTLPGHDKNLSKVTYEEWIRESERKLELLINKGYKKIYVIGHSMGGVIATYLSSKYKQVKKLVLLAPAFHVLNITNKEINIKESLKKIPKIIDTYKDELVGRFFKLDMSATKELMTLVREYYNTPKEVKCPTLILQGEEDHIVPKTSSQYVYNELNSKQKKLIFIKDVNHEICRSERRKEIFEIIEEFLIYNTEGGIDTI